MGELSSVMQLLQNILAVQKEIARQLPDYEDLYDRIDALEERVDDLASRQDSDEFREFCNDEGP